MKAVVWLRVAAVLAGLHGVLHTIGVVMRPTAGAQQTAVAAMTANPFTVAGLSRSYWDLLLGYGWFVTVFFLVQMVTLWQMSGIAKTNAAILRPIWLVMGLGWLLMAFVSWRYLFSLPLVFQAAIGVCVCVAWLRTK